MLFLGLLWHFSPRVPRCCWKQKLLSHFQSQSSALWASTGRTGSTSLAAAALASCLPWIGTSRDCLSLPVSLSWRSQPRSWKSCVYNCCACQRSCLCCKPWFCYPGYVCSSYLLSASGRWIFYLFSVYWRVVNSTNLLKYQRILFTFQFSVVYLILVFSSWLIQGQLNGALKCPFLGVFEIPTPCSLLCLFLNTWPHVSSVISALQIDFILEHNASMGAPLEVWGFPGGAGHHLPVYHCTVVFWICLILNLHKDDFVVLLV